MIKEVIPGEKLTAKTQNEIIQACNGLMQPSGQYINTPNGSLYPNPTPQFNNMLGRCVETLFQLKFELKQHLSKRIADEDRQTLSAEYALSSVWYGYSMNLGNDFSQLQEQVKLMQPDNDDIFIIGGQGIDGSGDSETGDRLSVHLTGSQMLADGSDKEGFFDLGVYWKSPTEGCSEIEVQQIALSSDKTQYGPTKNAFVIRGKNYPSESILEDWYEEKYGDTWTVTDSSTTTIGYVYDQKLVQLKTGLLFPQAAQAAQDATVDSNISALQLSSIQDGVYTDPDTGKETKYHQFFGFTDRVLDDYELSDGLDVVVRDYFTTGGNGARTNYISLSGLAEKIADEVATSAPKVDTRDSGTGLSSIDYDLSNSLELRNFHLLQNEYIPSQYPVAGRGYDLVLRERLSNNRADIKYTDLSAFLDGLHLYIDSDSEFYDNNSIGQSLRRNYDQTTGKEYVGLLNFNSHYSETLEASLEYGKSKYVVPNGNGASADANTDFLLWHKDHNGKPYLDYTDIKITLPKPNASDVDGLSSVIESYITSYVSVDLGPLSAKVDQLSSQLSNYWKVGGTYDDNCYGQSIGNSSQVLAIDIDNGGLWYESSQTLDWHNCELYNQNGADGPGNICLKWADRQGYDSGGNITLDWQNGKLSKPGAGAESVNWKVGYAQDPSGSGVVVNWNTGQLWADGNTRTLNWKRKQLIGDWSTQNGGLTIASGNTLKIGNTSLSEAQLSALLALI